MKKILIAGSIAYDYSMKYDGLFSESLIPDQLENLSVSFFIQEKSTNFGGCGGNIAFNLGLLEENPLLFSVVGSNFGEYEKWLIDKNVDVRKVIRYNDKETASAYIATDTKGSQITFFYPGAGNYTPALDLNDIKDEILLALISPDNQDRMMQVISECQKQRIPFFLDPGQQIPALPKGALMGALQEAKGVFINEYELNMLLRKIGLSEAQLIQAVGLLILTLGDHGSVIKTPQGKVEVNVVRPNKIVNPTGCGDAYRAGFLWGLKNGYNLEKCGKAGALLACYNIEQSGTQSHKFTKKEFEERLGL